MEFCKEETKLGTLWFIFAGSFACCLAVFLAMYDHTVTYSDAEKVRGEELKAVRTAQASLPIGKVDPRISQ